MKRYPSIDGIEISIRKAIEDQVISKFLNRIIFFYFSELNTLLLENEKRAEIYATTNFQRNGNFLIHYQLNFGIF